MSDKPKILLIGYFCSHVLGSKVSLLKSMGYEVHAFDVADYDFVDNVYEADFFYSHNDTTLSGISGNLSWYEKLRKLVRGLFFSKKEERMQRTACSLVTRVNPDIIWGVWGPKALKWLKAIRRNGYKGKIIWTANVMPNRLAKLESSSEDKLYRKSLGLIDGLILTNKHMLEFIQQRYPMTKDSNILLMPDFFPGCWYAGNLSVPDGNTVPKIVYLGAPERFGAEIDRVDDILLDLAENGINVYCARPKETSVEHPLINYYDRFDDMSFVNGEFGQFINQFNAAVVMYNYQGSHPRFTSTYPTRLFSSLCGRIPIFFKKGLLTACEEFITENGIGEVFTDGIDLKKTLVNEDLMKKYRRNAAKNSERFVSDNKNNAGLLGNFISDLSSRAK